MQLPEGVELRVAPDHGSRCSPWPVNADVGQASDKGKTRAILANRRRWRLRMVVKRAARLVSGVALLLSLAPFTADAQPSTSPRLCYVANTPSAQHDGAFLRSLHELGYVEGRNLTIHFRSAAGRPDRFPALADECVRLHADVIVALTTPGALAAKKATNTIPIVACCPGDPVGTGIVASLARPNGNATGLTVMSSGLSAKRLQLLKEAVPLLSKVSVLA